MQVQPYLFFDGRCEEAVEFYRTLLGAEVTMMSFQGQPRTASTWHDPARGRKQGDACELPHRRHDDDGLPTVAVRGRRTSRVFAVADGRRRGRGRAAVRGPGRRRAGADAVDEDLLFRRPSAWSPTASAFPGWYVAP